jgi:rhodanese-related sulfurtransferase
MAAGLAQRLAQLRVRKQVSQFRVRMRTLEANVADSVAMHGLAALPGPFLPWTSFSMRPAAILAILNDIEIYDRRVIVECGSGNSTIFAARLLALRGVGFVTTLEHDSLWAALTERLLERESLSQWARVVRAPLVDGWYDVTAIPALTAIDLLVVDGPPAWARHAREARAPALDYFADRLTDNSTVMLDDGWRRGERRVVDRWTETHSRRFRREPGGFAISAPHVS